MTKEEISNQSAEFIASEIKENVVNIKSKQSQHQNKTSNKNMYFIHDFIQYNNEYFDNEYFVENIFYCLLKRMPSTQEKEYFLENLHSEKYSKTELLITLRFSEEGRKHNIKILGIKKYYLLFRLYKVPGIGLLFKPLIKLLKHTEKLKELEQNLKLLKRDFETFKLKNTIFNIENSIEKKAEDFYAVALAQFPYDINKMNFEQKDLYYSLFEHAFYNHEAVMLKQQIYTKYIPDINSNYLPHIDIGCGRGELLTILKKNGFIAKGIDINSIEIGTLQDKGYDVYHSDMVTYLKNKHENYSSISALQVIEHLDYSTLKEFIALSYKALAQKGVIILETINPHNAFTLGSFYMDETHVRMLPPELVIFMLQHAGFKNIKILYSSPMPKQLRYNVVERDYHDYALIGYKL